MGFIVLIDIPNFLKLVVLDGLKALSVAFLVFGSLSKSFVVNL